MTHDNIVFYGKQMELSGKLLLLLMIVTLIIFILAVIELMINKHRCRYSVDVPKKCLVIMPRDSGFHEPIYIYDKSKIRKPYLDFGLGYRDCDYVKVKIPEHVASKVMKPINTIGEILKEIPHSKTPINDLYNSIGMSDNVISSANPLTYNDTNNYRMLIARKDSKCETFIANGKLYFV